MLRTVNGQPTLWESLLPEMCLGLPAELETVDRLLDDPVFFAPYAKHFHPLFGRPSVPIETYLRLMVRWRTGCEGRISCAKRDFGLARTRLDRIEVARTWCGHGVFAHNLVKLGALLPE